MLAVVMAVLYAVALLIVVRLMHSGRISGRGATLAIVGLAPTFGLAYVLLSGGPLSSSSSWLWRFCFRPCRSMERSPS